MMGPCEDYCSSLETYVDGELPNGQAQELVKHIAQCERCTAYHADLVRLRDSLRRLALDQDAPDLADGIVYRVRHRLWMRFGLAASCVVILKLLDVFGAFGSGVMPRLAVAVGALPVFWLLGIDPFRLVRPEQLLGLRENRPGVGRARA